MLQAIRDRASGWIAYIIVILICIPFALWGIHEYFGGGDPLLAAEVNGREIAMRTLNQEFQQQKRYLQSIMGGQLPAQYQDQVIRESALDRVVRNELLSQEVENAGYHVGDSVLFSRIKEMPVFSSNGGFDKERYEQILSAQRRSMAEFEQNLRQQIRVSHFIEGISESAFLPAKFLNDYLRLKNQERQFSYFIIAADLEAVAKEVSDTDIEVHYKAHPDRYRTPERMKLSYIELKEQDLIEKMTVTDELLREFYEAQADRYVDPEQRRARHILLKLPSSTKEDTDAKLKNQVEKHAEDLVKRLRADEDFTALANKYSEDKLSASSGGDLGFIARGEMDPEIEDVLFDLELNQISDPVSAENGLRIIQLTEIKPPKQRSFEEVRERVDLEYKQRTAESHYVDQTEQLLTLSYEQPDGLEPAADALGLEIKQTDWITANNGSGIATHARVRKAAFSEEILTQGRNSDLVELSDGHVVVLRMAEHQPAKLKALEDVEDEIRDIIAKQNAREQVAKRGSEAIKALQSGTFPSKLAQRLGAELKTLGFVRRDNDQVKSPILRRVFTLTKPGSETITPGGVQLSNGDYAVIVLKAVREVDLKEADRETNGVQQSQNYGSKEFEATYKAMELAADIRIMRENL